MQEQTNCATLAGAPEDAEIAASGAGIAELRGPATTAECDDLAWLIERALMCWRDTGDDLALESYARFVASEALELLGL